MNDDTPQGDATPAIDFGHYSSFLAFQSPLSVSFAAAAHGFPVRPLAGSFSYVELGSGSGLGLALLADAYPEARFLGIEPDAEQVARAVALADAGGLSNVEFIAAPLAAAPLPEADIITLSSLYSWIAPEERRALVGRAAGHLAPAGLFCVQYAALPGSIASDTLYSLIKGVAAGLEGDPATRLRGAVGRAIDLARAGGLFFQRSPAAAQMLQTITQSDPAQVGREIFRTRMHSLYVTEVLEELAEAGLRHAGSGQLELNYAELSVPATMRPVIDGVKNPAVRQLLIDHARNTPARVDLFTKAEPGGEADTAERLADFLVLRFSDGEETLARQQVAQRTGIDFTAAVYGDLLQAIGETPRPIGAVLDDAAVRKHARQRALRAVQFLIGTRFVQLARTSASTLAGDLPAAVRMPSALNRHLLATHVGTADTLALSSSVSGVRLTLSLPDRWMLHRLLGGAIEPVYSALLARGLQLKDKEGQPASLEQFTASIEGDLPAFRERTARQLARLGVLAQA